MTLRKNILGVLAAALVLSLAGVASAANMIVNGDFETGDLTGWEVHGTTGSSYVTADGTDNGPSEPGTFNAFMENYAEALGLLLKQSTPAGSAGEGDVYYSFDLKLDMAEIGGVLFVEIFAEQAGGGVIGGSGLMGPFWTWDWTNVSDYFVAPAGTDFLTIQFVATTGAAQGTNCVAHVDNVVLDQGSVATQDSDWSTLRALY